MSCGSACGLVATRPVPGSRASTNMPHPLAIGSGGSDGTAHPPADDAPAVGPGSLLQTRGTSLAPIAAVKQVARQLLRDSLATVSGSTPTALPRHPARPLALVRGTRSGRNPAQRGEIRLTERRGRDLNPRRTQRPVTVFETAAFDRSATPPREGQTSGTCTAGVRWRSGALPRVVSRWPSREK
jgi:hypothetical protein